MKCLSGAPVVFFVFVLLAGGVSSLAQDQSEQGGTQYATAQIEQMVAPIALYTDPLVIQICMAATYPSQVLDADQWIGANKDVCCAELDSALSQATWDPSVISVCKVPVVLHWLAVDTGWSTDLGYTFLYQQTDLLTAVQTLRKAAYEAGSLKSGEQQKVVVEQDAVEILPADPAVLYVPSYNPAMVYGQAWSYPVMYYPNMTAQPGGVPTGSFMSFGVGMAVGAAMFGACDWNHHAVYVKNDVFVKNNIYRNTNVYRNANASKAKKGGPIHNDRQSWAHSDFTSPASSASAPSPHGPGGFVGRHQSAPNMSHPPKRGTTYGHSVSHPPSGPGSHPAVDAGVPARHPQGKGMGQKGRPEPNPPNRIVVPTSPNCNAARNKANKAAAGPAKAPHAKATKVPAKKKHKK